MRRRGLRRSKPVRQAIARIWASFEGCRDHLDWAEKDLFLTFNGQLLKVNPTHLHSHSLTHSPSRSHTHTCICLQ